MLCKKCGAQIPDDSYKCEYCGEVFREEPAPEEIKAEDNADLGDTKIINPDEEEESTPEETPQRSTHEIFEENEKKRRSQAEKVIDEKQLQLEEITQRRNQKKQRQKRNKIILISIACVLVAAAAGAGTYYVRNGGFGSGTVIATPSPSVSPIPSLAPVQTSAVATPQATTETEATEKPENSSASGSGSSLSSSSASGSGNSSGSSSVSGNGSSSGSSSASGSGSSSGSSSASGNGSSSGSSSASGNGTTSSSGNVGSGTTVDTGKYSGAVSENIVSKLVVGNEVIHDGPSDRYFMTFNMDGTMYYANVSKGSTTSQINGKYITITAEPTSGRYDGNTVYEITSMTYYSGDYIIPDSGTKIIDKASLRGMSKDSLGLARNEIYARHGRKFQMEVYQKYFESKSWYKPNPNYDYTDDNKNLNEIELKNVETILSVENSK